LRISRGIMDYNWPAGHEGAAHCEDLARLSDASTPDVRQFSLNDMRS